MTDLLDVRGLRAGYAGREVVHGIDLRVAAGEMVALLGANGAGKTTTLRAICGQVPRRGELRVDGVIRRRGGPQTMLRDGVAQVPEDRGTFGALSVVDNLEAGAWTRRDRAQVRADIDRWCEIFPVLGQRRRQRAGLLSGGEQQMLAIARAMMSRPRLLLCDEPSLGLAPMVAAEVFEVLAQLRAQHGMSVLLVEQNVARALEMADRAYLLAGGVMVGAGGVRDLVDTGAVRRAYLGY
jgi:branched-chain amino acid transport system ATP-binding protein